MGDVIDFNTARKRNEFRESLKVDTSSFNRNQDYSRGRTITNNLVQGRREREATNYYNSLSTQEKMRIENERRKARQGDKKQIRGARSGKGEKYKGSKSRMTKAIAVGTGILLVLGAITGIKGYEASQNTQGLNNLEEIVQSENALEKLGISSETAEEIQSLQTELSSSEIENLSDSELLSLGNRVEAVQMDTIKSKLAKTLEVNEDEITVTPKYSMSSNESNTAYVTVSKDGEETVYNVGDFLDGNNNISQEISDSIISLGNTQTVNSKIKSGDFDKAGAIEQYRSGIDDVSKIAIKEMSMDDNGNISLSPVSQQEIDALIQNDGEER